MSGPLHGHPAIDIASEDGVLVAQERQIIGLDPLLLDALVSAGRASLPFQLVTPDTSRLTVPLDQLLRDTGGQWVSRRSDGRCWDGLNGRQLSWNGSLFTDPASGPVLDQQWADPQPTTSGTLAVDCLVLHPAVDDLLLGETAETCCAVLSDAELAGWGVAEPVSQRWDRRDLSDLARQRGPASSLFVVVGGSAERPVVGTLEVTPTSGGVRERLRLRVGAAGPVEYGRLDNLAELLAAATNPPRTALLGLQPGRADGTVEPLPTGATVPYGLLLGPAVVAGVGREEALAAPVPEARLLGPAAAPSLWAELLPEAGTADPAEALGRLLRHFRVPLDATG